MKNICDDTYEDLCSYLKAIDEPSYRADQIFQWLYQKGVDSFDFMTDLSEALRDRLKKDFYLPAEANVKEFDSSDHTRKFLFELQDKERVESVLIPAKDRTTVCISTQAGCKFRCQFCASGLNGWNRNLTCGEIVMQILHVKKMAGNKQPLSHVVFMGTGEPLDNYDEVLKAIHLLNSPKAFHIAARRITVSTCGLVPEIKKLSEEGMQIELAISLHGFDDDSRNILMPVNKKYTITDLVDACREYIKKTKRQITFEYILIKDKTCSEQAAQALGKLLKGMICKMNLIPYNPVEEFDHETPSKKDMLAFKDRLAQYGIHSTIRLPRGRDVNAACGQLRLRS